MKFLLDTNIISEIRKGERADSNVTRWVVRTPIEEIGTSVIVLAEIRRGIELKRRRHQEQAKSLDRWFAQMRARLGDRVLPIDEPIADAWALLGIPDPPTADRWTFGGNGQSSWSNSRHPQRRRSAPDRRHASRPVFRLARLVHI